MLRLIPSRSNLLTIAVVASVGCMIHSCSKDKGGGKNGSAGLRDPRAISPQFVNTAKSRQDASEQVAKAAKLSAKGSAGLHSLNIVAIEPKAQNLLLASSWSTASKLSVPSINLRLSDDSQNETSSLDILSDFMNLSNGDDCEKINQKFTKAYEWESSLVTSLVSLFGSSDKNDAKFGAGDDFYVSTYDGEDNVKFGMGANESLKQSVISLASAKDISVQQVTLLDEGAKTLTTKFFASGTLSDKSGTIRNLEMTLESIASGTPKIRFRENADLVFDGQDYKTDGDIAIAKTGERQFDVKGVQNTISAKEGKNSENFLATVTWGDDGKCKIAKK